MGQLARSGAIVQNDGYTGEFAVRLRRRSAALARVRHHPTFQGLTVPSILAI
jgi:hypothetical protein